MTIHLWGLQIGVRIVNVNRGDNRFRTQIQGDQLNMAMFYLVPFNSDNIFRIQAVFCTIFLLLFFYEESMILVNGHDFYSPVR